MVSFAQELRHQTLVLLCWNCWERHPWACQGPLGACCPEWGWEGSRPMVRHAVPG